MESLKSSSTDAPPENLTNKVSSLPPPRLVALEAILVTFLRVQGSSITNPPGLDLPSMYISNGSVMVIQMAD